MLGLRCGQSAMVTKGGFVVLLLLTWLLASGQSQMIQAQTGEAEPTGKLVVVPGIIGLGDTAEVVAFDVVPSDLQVSFEYGHHFAVEGEPCVDGTTRTTAPGPAPTWIPLTACTVGEGFVRLLEADSGTVIAEASVTVAETAAQQEDGVTGAQQGCGLIYDQPCPPAPSIDASVTKVNSNNFTISVSWNASGNVKEYDYRDGSLSPSSSTSTSATYVNIRCGRSYSFSVRYLPDGTHFAPIWSNRASDSATTDACPPPKPTGLSVTSSGCNSIGLDWNSRSGISKYRISFGSRTRETTSSSYTATGLSDDTSYTFSVSAYGNGSTYKAEWSSSASITRSTDDCTTGPPTPPKPTGLRVTSTGCSSIGLDWNSRSGISKYRISYGSNSPETTSSSYTATGLSQNTSFTFSVSAYGNGSTYEAEWGPSASITRSTDDCSTPPSNVPPEFSSSSTSRSVAENTSSGTNIGSPVTASDEDGDTLTYSIGGTNASSFSIVSSTGQLRTKSALDYETKSSYSVTVTAKDPSNASDSITVTISVTDVDETGPPAIITFPGRVSRPSITTGDERLTVSWTAPSSGSSPITRYKVRYRAASDANTAWNNENPVSAASRSTTIDYLSNGTEYDVQVRACNGPATNERCGEWSQSGSGTPRESTTPQRRPIVTIARHNDQGATITEGDEVRFTLRASPTPTTNLTVNVSIGDSLQGGYLTGSIPKTIQITSGRGTKDITLQTEDDSVDEANGIISASVKHGTGYRVGSSSLASVSVEDNDLPRPPEPTGVSAKSFSNESVTVSWKYSSGTKVYNVQYRRSEGIGWRTGLVSLIMPGSIFNLATITGLKCETRYKFRVREWGDRIAYRADWGPFSEVFHGTTGACDPVTPAPPQTPPPPSDKEYAPLEEPREPILECRHIPLVQYPRMHPRQQMTSEDGRHKAWVDLYTTKQPFDLNTHCIEARFISESTPGADRIEWEGTVYKTERKLNLEGLSLGAIGLMDRITLMGRYEDQSLKADTPEISKAPPKMCETCRGGPNQSQEGPGQPPGILVETRLLKIPTIFARGNHTFVVDGASVSLPSAVDWMMPIATNNCYGGFDCFMDLQGTIEDELSEDVDTGLLGVLINVITEIVEWFD